MSEELEIARMRIAADILIASLGDEKPLTISDDKTAKQQAETIANCFHTIYQKVVPPKTPTPNYSNTSSGAPFKTY